MQYHLMSFAIGLIRYLQEKNIQIDYVYLSAKLGGQKNLAKHVKHGRFSVREEVGTPSFARKKIGKYIGEFIELNQGNLPPEKLISDELSTEIIVRIPVETISIGTPEYSFFVDKNKNVLIYGKHDRELFNDLQRLGYQPYRSLW
jgi:hypothetical protein